MFRIKLICFLIIIALTTLESATDCTKLRVGQFLCPDPANDYAYIDEKTQSVKGCTKEGKATVRCIAADGIECLDTLNRTFSGTIPCDYT